MALKTLVKISEVNNLSDARYCAGMGVEMLGFTLDENHPKFIDIAKLREISVWISGPKVVGEFSGENIQNINYLSEQLNLDFIQLNHPVQPEQMKLVRFPIIQKLEMDKFSISELEIMMNERAALVDFFLLEDGADILEKNKETIKSWAEKYKIILGAGVTMSNIDKILNEINPAGIALKGGEELKPGLNNFDELRDILEILETE
jgi:phosphoribosylanthranilate isomerase